MDSSKEVLVDETDDKIDIQDESVAIHLRLVLCLSLKKVLEVENNSGSVKLLFSPERHRLVHPGFVWDR